MQDDDDGDEGFVADLARMRDRRGVLVALGLAGAGALVTLAAARAMAQAEAPGACAVPAAETAGPFPADGTTPRNGPLNVLTESGVIRRDITPSFAGLPGRAEGIALSLAVQVVQAGTCAPLPGVAMYLWHCDAAGDYSLYSVPGANWLRGMQIADADGMIRFDTILPGCYPGRWPHLHVELFDTAADAVSGRAARLTSQFALPEGPLAALYAGDDRYAASRGPLARLSLATDMVFADNSAAEMRVMTLTLTGDGAGLAATGRIALSV